MRLLPLLVKEPTMGWVRGGLVGAIVFLAASLGWGLSTSPAGGVLAQRNSSVQESVSWLQLHEQFHQIGFPEERAVWDLYWNIIFLNNPEQFTNAILTVPDGRGGWIAMDLNLVPSMSEQERQAFAEEWLAAHEGGQQAVQKLQRQRAAFKQAHPEYIDYLNYRDTLIAHPEDLAAFQTSAGQPNRRLYGALWEERVWLASHGVRGEALEAALEAWLLTGEAFLIAVEEDY
jgi:hypothetical protein